MKNIINENEKNDLDVKDVEMAIVGMMIKKSIVLLESTLYSYKSLSEKFGERDGLIRSQEASILQGTVDAMRAWDGTNDTLPSALEDLQRTLEICQRGYNYRLSPFGQLLVIVHSQLSYGLASYVKDGSVEELWMLGDEITSPKLSHFIYENKKSCIETMKSFGLVGHEYENGSCLSGMIDIVDSTKVKISDIFDELDLNVLSKRLIVVQSTDKAINNNYNDWVKGIEWPDFNGVKIIPSPFFDKLMLKKGERIHEDDLGWYCVGVKKSGAFSDYSFRVYGPTFSEAASYLVSLVSHVNSVDASLSNLDCLPVVAGIHHPDGEMEGPCDYIAYVLLDDGTLERVDPYYLQCGVDDNVICRIDVPVIFDDDEVMILDAIIEGKENLIVKSKVKGDKSSDEIIQDVIDVVTEKRRFSLKF